MKNYYLVVAVFILGNITGTLFFNFSFFKEEESSHLLLEMVSGSYDFEKSGPLDAENDYVNDDSSDQSMLKPELDVRSSLLTEQVIGDKNVHMLSYLVEHDIVDENASIKEVQQVLLEKYQDTSQEFNVRLDNISMYSQLNNRQVPEEAVESLITDLHQLDEAHEADQIIQVVGLLKDNISEYQLYELSTYLDADDPYVQASTLQTIGQSDTYNEYQAEILSLWRNSAFPHVRERAYFTLKKYYQYEFDEELKLK